MSRFRGGYLFNVGFHYATEDEKNSSQKFDCALWRQISLDALKFLVSFVGFGLVLRQIVETTSMSVLVKRGGNA